MKIGLMKFFAIFLLSIIGSIVQADDVLWIDVRSAGEFKAGHLPDAINIPHKEIGERIGNATNNKGAQIKLYCGSGRRAKIAQRTLEGMGFTEVSNAGGYTQLIKTHDVNQPKMRTK